MESFGGLPLEGSSLFCDLIPENSQSEKSQRTPSSSQEAVAIPLFQHIGQENTASSYDIKKSLKSRITQLNSEISSFSDLICQKEINRAPEKEIQKLVSQKAALKLKKQKKIELLNELSPKRQREDSSLNVQKIKIQVKAEMMGRKGVKLSMMGIKTVKDTLKFAQEANTEITRLDLMDCTDFTDDDIEKIINYCPNINQFFVKSNRITDRSLQLVMKLTKLTHLYIQGNITDDGMLSVVDQLAGLTQLFINGFISLDSATAVLGKVPIDRHPNLDASYFFNETRAHFLTRVGDSKEEEEPQEQDEGLVDLYRVNLELVNEQVHELPTGLSLIVAQIT